MKRSAITRFTLLLALGLAAMSIWAAPVDEREAQMRARDFLSNELYAGRIMSSQALTPVLLKAVMGNSKLADPVYYIYNTSSTFVVVAGDDRAEGILAYGDRPLDMNNIPPGLQDMLNQYQREVEFLQEHPGLKVNPVVGPANTPSLRAASVGPLLTAEWDQTAPYYNQCVFAGYQCLTGCPATSASMVFHYWKYPTSPTPVVPGYESIIGTSYSPWEGYMGFDYTHSALPSVTFDWNNMLDSYSGGYTTAQATAVATLMRYVGQAERMEYGTSSFGGSGVSSDSVCNIANAFIFFGYDASSVRYVKKTSAYSGGTTLYSDSQWASMIQQEMTAGRPIVFCAVDGNGNGGHAFNVDGYNSSTNKYHINFGWSGDGNAWCSLNAFGYSDYYGSYNFNVYQQMVIGIQPPQGGGDEPVPTPTLTVTPGSLSFETTLGSAVSKTFTVRGSNLTGNVTLSKSDANGAYTVTPTTISASEAAAGKTVTVTYNPNSSGSHYGTITASSAGASSVSVALSGSVPSPVLTVSPGSLSFATTVGCAVSKTFTVRGSNLTGNVTLSKSDANGAYTITPTTISASEAAVGKTVTVTYNPSAVGSQYATITVKSAGATSATVSLSGTASVPEIEVSTSTLTMSAEAGETVTRSFTVTAYDLTGNLSLSLSGNTEAFSITPTSITPTAATWGTTVRVTYRPTAAGTHRAVVTISGGGAEPVAVTLTGTATIPVPVITPSTPSMAMTAFTGSSQVKTFSVTGRNLSGNLSLALNDDNGVYSITPTVITPTAAANGATVTVTYSPVTFGAHAASITISGGGAEEAVVALNGVAELETYAPVMQAANPDHVQSTRFRADWTDETPRANVSGYTLEVSLKPDVLEVASADFAGVTKQMTGSVFTNMVNSCGNYLPEGWTATGKFYVYDDYVMAPKNSTISTCPLDLAGFDKLSVVIDATCYMFSYYNGATLMVSTSAGSENISITKSGITTFTVVLDCTDGDVVTFTGVTNNFGICAVRVYAGDITAMAPTLALESGDGDYRLVTAIDAMSLSYTVAQLTAGGTFRYRVKAHYIDGSESNWSNTQEVTLSGMEHQPGDLDHDGMITIDDVTQLLAYLLGSGEDVCTECADANDDLEITVGDVTAIISLILTGS